MSGTATADNVYTIPTAVSWGAPHLELFTFTEQGQMLWKYKPPSSSGNGDTAAWAQGDIGFQVVDAVASLYQHSPVVFTRGNHYTNVYVRNGETLGTLYEKEHDENMEWYPGGNADNWTIRANDISSAPGIATWTETEMNFFYIASDKILTYFSWDTNYTTLDGLSTGRVSNWGGTKTLSGLWEAYRPAVLSWGSQRLDVFVVNPEDNALYHNYYSDEGFQPSFAKLGGHLISPPVAVNATRGRIDVFARGGDSGLWWKSFDDGAGGSWGEWTGISQGYNGTGLKIRGEPTAIVHEDLISVFAWSENSTLLHRRLSWKDNTWEPADGMDEVASGLDGPANAIHYIQTQLDVFAHTNGQMGHKIWDISSNTWSPKEPDNWELLGAVN
jgi:hypothetical protein